jgi:hypothetical protein
MGSDHRTTHSRSTRTVAGRRFLFFSAPGIWDWQVTRALQVVAPYSTVAVLIVIDRGHARGAIIVEIKKLQEKAVEATKQEKERKEEKT